MIRPPTFKSTYAAPTTCINSLFATLTCLIRWLVIRHPSLSVTSSPAMETSLPVSS